ncbi:GDSL-type esterase/lipase family protein [Salisediminibacterium selenitireducens]|uniref:Lipolytic protein G-D-S-L family n=1 Tax=Bacillus selenitireducens (strain ATCC 700615 / DSM 15326 / MLS10) TaxID=439292 RepID=D6Y065_BACIE|nr:GDSL-type esterase/lipase family protein [Salisediminibacterium selenitireducens]ADH98456.1 lipolytic protein G-D-S-L family [[Bacillus] selenitireducens MLS10]
MRTYWINGLLLASIAAVLLFAGGFGYAMVDQVVLQDEEEIEVRPGAVAPERQVNRIPLLPVDGSYADVPEVADDGATRLVALGDSLTRGMGSTDGDGYLRHVEEAYPEDRNSALTVVNAAVNGYRTEDVVRDLAEGELNGQLRAADLVVMTVGGNDLFQGGQGLFQDLDTFTEEARESFLQGLAGLYDELTSLNPEAPVYHIGIYNPFRELDFTGETARYVREWNYATLELAAEYDQVIFVPVEDVFERNVSDYLFRDFFHLNDAGYERMAERLLTTLRWPEEEGS